MVGWLVCLFVSSCFSQWLNYLLGPTASLKIVYFLAFWIGRRSLFFFFNSNHFFLSAVIKTLIIKHSIEKTKVFMIDK